MTHRKRVIPAEPVCDSCKSTERVSSVLRAGKVRSICVNCLTKRGIGPVVPFDGGEVRPARVFAPKVKPPHVPNSVDKLREVLKSKGIKGRGMVSMATHLCGSKHSKRVARALIDAWFNNGCPDFAVKRIRQSEKISVRTKIKKTEPATPVRSRREEYSDYLASDLWNAIRRFVLLSASYTCKGCGCQANQVHHTSYDEMTMRGRDVSKLVSLCGRCHCSIEFNEAGEKVNLKEANERLADLIASKNAVAEVDTDLDREFTEIFR